MAKILPFVDLAGTMAQYYETGGTKPDAAMITEGRAELVTGLPEPGSPVRLSIFAREATRVIPHNRGIKHRDDPLRCAGVNPGDEVYFTYAPGLLTSIQAEAGRQLADLLAEQKEKEEADAARRQEQERADRPAPAEPTPTPPPAPPAAEGPAPAPEKTADQRLADVEAQRVEREKRRTARTSGKANDAKGK